MTQLMWEAQELLASMTLQVLAPSSQAAAAVSSTLNVARVLLAVLQHASMPVAAASCNRGKIAGVSDANDTDSCLCTAGSSAAAPATAAAAAVGAAAAACFGRCTATATSALWASAPCGWTVCIRCVFVIGLYQSYKFTRSWCVLPQAETSHGASSLHC